MKLAIECSSDNGADYGTIHREGCRDLRDPERIGDAETRADAMRKADAVTAWAENEGEDPVEYGYRLAPCASLPKGAYL